MSIVSLIYFFLKYNQIWIFESIDIENINYLMSHSIMIKNVNNHVIFKNV